MNNLLPRYDELIPILDKNNTFFDCGFNVSFEELEFKKKLQVINDIVRQTILPIYPLQPNPQDEVETLIGNCHTAALVSKKYLEELKIGKNIRYVMARKRPFDPDNITTKHAILLIDDDLGNTYQYDATPFVGYKFGCVERIDIERFYDEYVEIKGKLKHLLYVLRKILYDISIEKIELKHMRYYIKKLEESEKYSILNGIVASIYVKLSKLCVLSQRRKLLKKAEKLNPYLNINSKERILRYEKVIEQLILWNDELKNLNNSKKNLCKKLELMQNITQEIKSINQDYEKWFIQEDKKIRMSHLSPRYLYENKLNTVFIKPSAYKIGITATIREIFVKKYNGKFNEYKSDLSQPGLTGEIPMYFSHPIGVKNIEAMSGTTNVILVPQDANELNMLKKEIRSKYGKNITYNTYVPWFNGKKILWHPFRTNLMHAADNYCESCLHFLIAYPEHQLMTRFMYPNPKLS